jgi:hypothetical protein
MLRKNVWFLPRRPTPEFLHSLMIYSSHSLPCWGHLCANILNCRSAKETNYQKSRSEFQQQSILSAWPNIGRFMYCARFWGCAFGGWKLISAVKSKTHRFNVKLNTKIGNIKTASKQNHTSNLAGYWERNLFLQL